MQLRQACRQLRQAGSCGKPAGSQAGAARQLRLSFSKKRHFSLTRGLAQVSLILNKTIRSAISRLRLDLS